MILELSATHTRLIHVKAWGEKYLKRERFEYSRWSVQKNDHHAALS